MYLAGPADDWCAVINGTIGNDIVLLSPGEYTGPCDANADLSDIAAEETAVASLDPLLPAVFVGSAADYVLRFTGERLLLLEVVFRDLPPGVDAVRADGIRELWLKRVRFEGGDRGLVQVGTVEELRVVETSFLSTARPLDLGCDGGCPVPLVEVSSDLVVGGVEAVHLGEGTVGSVLDNVIVGVEAGVVAGAGVEVRGNLIEATSVALSGAPTEVEANVVLGPAALGPGTVVGNTFTGGVVLPGWTAGGRFEGNAVVGPIPDPGGAGNVSCGDPCFTDAPGWDFYPAPGSPLREAGAAGLGADWCGRVRSERPSAGAIEAFTEGSFGPLSAVFKDEVDCDLPEDPPPSVVGPGDTGEPPSPEQPPAAEEPRPATGCCSTADGPGAAWGFALVCARLARRRPA